MTQFSEIPGSSSHTHENQCPLYAAGRHRLTLHEIHETKSKCELMAFHQ